MSTAAVRLEDVEERGALPRGLDTGTMSYWRAPDGWYLYLPGGGLGRLSNHTVDEHADGTITVSPSVLVQGGRGRRHGFVRRGVWEPCGDDQPVEDR